MMRAVKSLIGKRRVSPSLGSLATAAWLAGLLAWAGCGPPPPPPDGGNSLFSSATKQVTISATFTATPGTLNLSRNNRDTFRWHNASSVDLLIVFKDEQGDEFFPGRLLIPAGKFSTVFQVCKSCAKKTYDYKFYRKVGTDWVEAVAQGTPPTVPDIGVGD